MRLQCVGLMLTTVCVCYVLSNAILTVGWSISWMHTLISLGDISTSLKTVLPDFILALLFGSVIMRDTSMRNISRYETHR